MPCVRAQSGQLVQRHLAASFGCTPTAEEHVRVLRPPARMPVPDRGAVGDLDEVRDAHVVSSIEHLLASRSNRLSHRWQCVSIIEAFRASAPRAAVQPHAERRRRSRAAGHALQIDPGKRIFDSPSVRPLPGRSAAAPRSPLLAGASRQTEQPPQRFALRRQRRPHQIAIRRSVSRSALITVASSSSRDASLPISHGFVRVDELVRPLDDGPHALQRFVDSPAPPTPAATRPPWRWPRRSAPRTPRALPHR